MTNLGFKPVLSYTKPHTNSTIIGEEKGNNALTLYHSLSSLSSFKKEIHYIQHTNYSSATPDRLTYKNLNTR